MSDWIAIAQWSACTEMAKPGIIFEIRNAQDQRLFTPCTTSLPEMPFDWKSPPVAFRTVPEPPAQRSDPIPAPARQSR